MKLNLMKCGHISMGTKTLVDSNGNSTTIPKPTCVICDCDEVIKVIDTDVSDTDGLNGRTAKCTECSTTTKSKWSLPFFKYKPDCECDSYYCGCYGWD